MKFVLAALGLLAALAAPDPARSEGVPGADDPALRKAAEMWLENQDPRPAMWAVGELALEGNDAARMVARTMHRECRHNFPEMDRDDCTALFPPEPDRKPGLIRPYRTTRSPSFDAGIPMYKESAEGWVTRAQAMLDQGFRDRFLQEVEIVLTQKTVDIEAALFAENVVTFDDRQAMDLWVFLGLEEYLFDYWEKHEPEKAANRRARWGGPIRTPEREARFLRALDEGRWTAIRAASFLQGYKVSLPIDPDRAELYRRWLVLTVIRPGQDLGDEPPPTDEELETLGTLLIRDAARTPYLRPNLNACERLCPDEVSYCMAAGVLRRIELRYMLTSLQPVVPTMTYYNSPRAERELLTEAGANARRRGWGPEWLRVPHCFTEAADAAWNRLSPRPEAPH